MDIIPLLVPDAEPALLEQPRERGLDHIAPSAQAAAMFRVSSRDQRPYAALPQRSPNLVLGIICPVSKNTAGSFPGPASGPLDRLDRGHQRHGHVGIMDVGPGVLDRQRCAVAVSQKVTLRTIFPTIGGIRPS